MQRRWLTGSLSRRKGTAAAAAPVNYDNAALFEAVLAVTGREFIES
jgi:hypothetical protein